MLDLDSLAEQRAQSLNQSPEGWVKAVWGAGFQKLTANMTDGEVEELISLCPSVGHLEWLAKFLNEKTANGSASPYSFLVEEAARAGIAPGEWINKCFSSGTMT